MLKVEVLDAISIGISVLRGDFATAGSVMFLLELGELLEEWTHKKTVEDLAKCMSLNVDRAWVRTAAGEVIVPVAQIQPGDLIVMRAGSIIPTDGVVTEGYAAVNQASLTGESVPMEKKARQSGICRNSGGRRRMCFSCDTDFGSEPVQPDCFHD